MRCSGSTVTLPRLGTIRTHEPTQALAGKIAEGKAKILSASVSRSAQRWFVSFAVEVEREVPDHHRRPRTAVGLDLGISSLIMAVDRQGADSGESDQAFRLNPTTWFGRIRPGGSGLSDQGAETWQRRLYSIRTKDRPTAFSPSAARRSLGNRHRCLTPQLRSEATAGPGTFCRTGGGGGDRRPVRDGR